MYNVTLPTWEEACQTRFSLPASPPSPSATTCEESQVGATSPKWSRMQVTAGPLVVFEVMASPATLGLASPHTEILRSLSIGLDLSDDTSLSSLPSLLPLTRLSRAELPFVEEGRDSLKLMQYSHSSLTTRMLPSLRLKGASEIAAPAPSLKTPHLSLRRQRNCSAPCTYPDRAAAVPMLYIASCAV